MPEIELPTRIEGRQEEAPPTGYCESIARGLENVSSSSKDETIY